MATERSSESKSSTTLGNRQVVLSALLLVAAIVLLHVACVHFFQKAERDPCVSAPAA